MASVGLPEVYRKKVIFWGTTLAVVLRIILTFIAALLLKIPLIQLIGDLLLAWTAGKMIVEDKAVETYLHAVPFGEIAIPLVLTAGFVLIEKRIRNAKLQTVEESQ